MARKLIKNKCEIETCGESDPHALQLHHIIPRVEINTSNHNDNLAIICSNCHAKVHAGRIRILGVYPGTRLPNARVLVYELDGVPNIQGIEQEYLPFKNRSMKLY